MTELTDQQLPVLLRVSLPQQGANRADQLHGLYWFGQISIRRALKIGKIHGCRQGG